MRQNSTTCQALGHHAGDKTRRKRVLKQFSQNASGCFLQNSPMPDFGSLLGEARWQEHNPRETNFTLNSTQAPKFRLARLPYFYEKI